MSDTPTTLPANGETRYYDNCTIKAAGLYEPRFPERAAPDDFEIGFTVTVHEDGQPDRDVEVWLEVSSAYGVGNNASKRRAEIAVDEVAKLGYAHGRDLSKIEELVGKPCRITAKYTQKNERGFWNYYFNSARPKTRASGDLAARMARIMGESAATGAAPAPVATADSSVNPFM